MKMSVNRESLKLILIGGIAISIFGGLFMAANNYVFASNEGKPILVPTKYNESEVKEDVSPNYVKAKYSVLENNLMPSTNDNAIPVNDAAEIGAQYLWDMFETNLNGKTIYMSYTVDPSRGIAYWNGDIYSDKSDIVKEWPECSFSIEAISGTRDSAQCPFNENNEKTVGYKESEANNFYKANCDEFLDLAKKAASKQMTSSNLTAKFKGTGAVIALGYEYEMTEGKSTTVSVGNEEKNEEQNTIKVPQGGEIQASCVFIEILVSDENGNQTQVVIDTADKSLISIKSIYNGVDYDPDSVG